MKEVLAAKKAQTNEIRRGIPSKSDEIIDHKTPPFQKTAVSPR
jgi:hypothetical protein